MEKEDIKEKAKESLKKATKCYTDLTPEKKRLVHYTAFGFGVGLVLGLLMHRRRE